MRQNHYHVTIRQTADRDGQPIDGVSPLEFNARCHDDLLVVVEKLKQHKDLNLDAETTTMLAVGLKLFGEVLLENRQQPLFAPLFPHFGEFMKRLKGGLQK